MKITYETSVRNFQFWEGAEQRTENLTSADWDIIEAQLEELYPDGVEDGDLNDFFWFEFDTVAQWLGYEDEEDMDRKRDPDYEEIECAYCYEDFDACNAVYSSVTKEKYCCEDCKESAESDFFDEHKYMAKELIPDWSLPYLVNGDASGLSDEDKAIVDEWMEETGFNDIEVLKDEKNNAEFFFSTNPAFGEPTDVVECVIQYNV